MRAQAVIIFLVLLLLIQTVIAQGEPPAISKTPEGLGVNGFGLEDQISIAKIPTESFTRQIKEEPVTVKRNGIEEVCTPTVGCTEWSGEVEGKEKGCKRSSTDNLIKIAEGNEDVTTTFEETRHCKVIESCGKPTITVQTRRKCKNVPAIITLLKGAERKDVFERLKDYSEKITTYSTGSFKATFGETSVFTLSASDQDLKAQFLVDLKIMKAGEPEFKGLRFLIAKKF